ncbi:hypothetical protein HPB50_013648 [Hyalomma asiaticum]|uniref:Uncharacterized protein n=1 Tax=Hyalomma asiaticum TaxID=266040 RepID=A0ACB7TK93_HYAAI|nr:hypothetical protein HPB50_013648 [Hyalomma asiaticum]
MVQMLMDNPSFGLGLRVSNAQAAKTLGNKKGKLVCKDTAQALWSSSVLAKRSVRGNVAPKKRALGELPKQQLTPEKVDVVAGMGGGRARKGGSNGGPVEEAPARAKMSAPGEAQQVALVRVNTARKSFPAACETHKKHRKRFFRGGTYGLYLSVPRRKRHHRKAGSDESGTSMDGEATAPEAGKENSCPPPSTQAPAEESTSEGNSQNGAQPVEGSAGWDHDSSIASSVKSRQRVKRRLMDDHVDVDEVSICSSSSPPDGPNKKAPPRKGINGGGPFCQADLNCVRLEVVVSTTWKKK